jgi:hypothetical protein
MISFKSERTRHRIGCGEGVYRVGMGAGGQWAAGEGVADGAHGFRVVKISVVSDVVFARGVSVRMYSHTIVVCFYIRIPKIW